MPWLKLFPLLLTLLSFLQPLAANASTLLLPLAAVESADVSADVSAAHRDTVSFCRSTAKDSSAHRDTVGANLIAVIDGTATAVYSFYAAMPAAAAILRNAEASGQGVITAIRRAGLAGEEAGGLVQHGPLNPGPLPEAVANTFRGGSYTANTVSEVTTLYRVYGGRAMQIGGYWTRTKPAGPVQAIIDSALNPQWGNPATNVAVIRVPAGTTIYEGTAAAQGGLVGGGSQVFIPNVNPAWLVP